MARRRTLDIDFRRIRSFPEGQAAAFEEFCCQLAHRAPGVSEGSRFWRIRGAGGDGGIECYWKLPDGQEWGWQAKYVFGLPPAKRQLDSSIQTAIRIHPRLTKYFICLPFDLTGRRNQRGRSQQECFEDYVQEWQTAAHLKGIDIEFVPWSKSILTDKLLEIDPHHGRLRYWFDETYFSDEWFIRHINAATVSAGPRYTPRLNIKTAVTKAFEALGRTGEWLSALKNLRLRIPRVLGEWQRALACRGDDSTMPAYPDQARSSGQVIEEALRKVDGLLTTALEEEQTAGSVSGVSALVEEALTASDECFSLIEADIDRRYGKGSAQSQGFRQFQAEYMVSFPAANLDRLQDAIDLLRVLREWAGTTISRLPEVAACLVTGPAGIGKTHAFCDSAAHRNMRGLRSILLFGGQFSDTLPWERIRGLIGLDAAVSKQEMFHALDTAAEATGYPLIIFIDALNETEPRSAWQAHLTGLLEDLKSYPMLRLCISCRTGYLRSTLPTGHNLVEVVHVGFAGQEFDACREFFLAYNLAPPSVPFFQPEFANPLFLKLVCESLQEQGLSAVPDGWRGISHVVAALLRHKNERLALKYDYLETEHIVQDAVAAFVRALRDASVRGLPFIDARRAIDRVLPDRWPHGSIIQDLIREDLLIIDAQPNTDAQEPTEVIRISFDRLGDHLIARQMLDGVATEGLTTAFQGGGVFHGICRDADTMDENDGLLEALGIQMPEMYGVEFPDCMDDTTLLPKALRVFVSGLVWREPRTAGARSEALVFQALRTRGLVEGTLNAILSLSTRPASPLNALWLHRLLNGLSLIRRDELWCPFLHLNYRSATVLYRLIDSALEADGRHIPDDVATLWLTALSWCCAASDRRVRDHATKAMVNLGQVHTQCWPEVFSRILAVDDDYVVERCLTAAYGSLLRNPGPEELRAVATVVFEMVLSRSISYQNAMIRDNARLIVELAREKRVLPEGVSPDDFRPPYESDWPLVIPSEEDVKKHEDSHGEMPRLYASCFRDDFYTYVIGPAVDMFNGIDRLSAARWIFQSVLDTGYRGTRLCEFDGYLVGKYGGGRARPSWVERISKKYQWIALYRLLARLSDHLDRKEPEPWGYAADPPLQGDGRRFLDPSLLVKSEYRHESESWWMPVTYNYGRARSICNRDWLDNHEDMPDTGELLNPKKDEEGRAWLLLDGMVKWAEKADDIDFSDPFRNIYIMVKGYIARREDAERFWRWLRTQDFMGRWMPEGGDIHNIYVGEYPHAITVSPSTREATHYSGEQHDIPCVIEPTGSWFNINHDYDCYQDSYINMLVPRPLFFEGNPLVWDGLSGYLLDGERVLQDPHMREPGCPALLVREDFMRRFLKERGLCLFWTVLAEKQILAMAKQNEGLLEYCRAHMLKENGILGSAPLTKRVGPFPDAQ